MIFQNAIPLLFWEIVLLWSMSFKTDTPIAQGIEHRPPEAGAAVRIRLGVFYLCLKQERKDVAV